MILKETFDPLLKQVNKLTKKSGEWQDFKRFLSKRFIDIQKLDFENCRIKFPTKITNRDERLKDPSKLILFFISDAGQTGKEERIEIAGMFCGGKMGVDRDKYMGRTLKNSKDEEISIPNNKQYSKTWSWKD